MRGSLALLSGCMLIAASTACRTVATESDAKSDPGAPLVDYAPTAEADPLEGLVPETLAIDVDVVRKLGDGFNGGNDRYPVLLKIWKRLPKVATVPAAEWRERISQAFALSYPDGGEPEVPMLYGLERVLTKEMSTFYAGKSDAQLTKERERLEGEQGEGRLDDADFEYLNGRVSMQLLLNEVAKELRTRFKADAPGLSIMYPLFDAGHKYTVEDDCGDRYDCHHQRKPAFVFANPEFVALLVVLQTNG